MFEIRRYTSLDKVLWDKYVARSRNATFLFFRDYMDYHSDRFHDHSLLFFSGRHLYAVLPAHEQDDTFYSHFGLTYGGLLIDDAVTTADVLHLFDDLNTYLRQQGFRRVLYRAIPWIFSRQASEEDLYAMFWRCQARMQQRMSGSVVFMQEHQLWRKDHRRRLRQAQEHQVRVERGGCLAEFWPLLTDNLMQRFQSRPVHTLDEIQLLQSRFPDNIIQYNAYVGSELVGGITFYVMGHVLHGQYSGTNDLGKKCGAMEAIYDQVMYHDFTHMRYLSFGTSNEEGGLILNEGLIAHKEGYGGHTVCFDTYEWTL